MVNDGDVRGFLHVCCLGTYRDVVWEMVHALLESRLFDRSALIEVGVLGSEEDQQFVEDLLKPFDRFRIAYRSTDLTQFEFPTLGLLQDACQTWDGPVYYMHTKGVSYSPHNQYSRYWRRFMLDQLVTNHQKCIDALQTCDTAGTNWSDEGKFYSGNFWWARASHIRGLPDIRELQRNPRQITRDRRADGKPIPGRGLGPVWNLRMQCENWLTMNPTRTYLLGDSRPNLYRELLWTVSVTDIVNELLDVSPNRSFAQLSEDGLMGHTTAVRVNAAVAVAVGSQPATPDVITSADFIASDPPAGGYDVVLIGVRADPQTVVELIESCVPKLSPDGVIVVHHSNPPTAWHQRPAQIAAAAEWTGQVWRSVVEFRIRRPQYEVFTVDTHWGCTIIRPSRPGHRVTTVDSVNKLGWREFVEMRDELLDVVDVAWFRRNLYAAKYRGGAAQPATLAEFANALIATEGLDSYLQIGAADDVLPQIIAPIRHAVHSGQDATYRMTFDEFCLRDQGMPCYDLIFLHDLQTEGQARTPLELALARLSDRGRILIQRPMIADLDQSAFEIQPATFDENYAVVCRRAGHDAVPNDDHLAAPQQNRIAIQPYDANIDLLLAAVELDPDDIRSIFYLADAYYDAGDYANARTWYQRALDSREWWWNGLDTGFYIAAMRIAELMAKAGEPWPNVREAYLSAWEIQPERTAPLHAIALQYSTDERYQLGYLYAEPAKNLPCPDPDHGRLACEPPVWSARDELAVCAFMIGKQAEAFALWRELLTRSDLPEEDRARMTSHRDDCIPVLIKASCEYPDQMVRWLSTSERGSGITVTLTAGPGRESAELTLNSFLNCCLDINRVGRFLVVDGGLSPADRAALQQSYPFIEFIDGPAQLANIRSYVETRLWLHLQQGWRFFAEEQLVSRLERVLDAEPHVFRVAISLDETGWSPGLRVSETAIRQAADSGRYALDDYFVVPSSSPAMYDTVRLDRAGGLGPTDRPDGDSLPALRQRANSADLLTARLDEPLAVGQTIITVIGRGNSGTRAISNTLIKSGVSMGEPIKEDTADLVPAEDLYEACRIISRYIPWQGGLNWDFGPVQTMPIPKEFTELVNRYLFSVLKSPAPFAGWKLPETTLCYPWIRRLFPDVKYIFWIRNPRDCIVGQHLTDDLRVFGIEYPETDDEYLRRAISWKYQDDLVAATPQPRNWIAVRMEDFITHQERELTRLEEYLGMPLARIPVSTDSIDRHKQVPEVPLQDFLIPSLNKYGYGL